MGERGFLQVRYYLISWFIIKSIVDSPVFLLIITIAIRKERFCLFSMKVTHFWFLNAENNRQKLLDHDERENFSGYFCSPNFSLSTGKSWTFIQRWMNWIYRNLHSNFNLQQSCFANLESCNNFSTTRLKVYNKAAAR